MSEQRPSRYVAYVDHVKAITCCQEGHPTALKAAQHAHTIQIEQAARKAGGSR